MTEEEQPFEREAVIKPEKPEAHPGPAKKEVDAKKGAVTPKKVPPKAAPKPKVVEEKEPPPPKLAEADEGAPHKISGTVVKGSDLIVGDYPVVGQEILVFFPGGRTEKAVAGNDLNYGKGGFSIQAREIGAYTLSAEGGVYRVQYAGGTVKLRWS